jgi:hypothetical protein
MAAVRIGHIDEPSTHVGLALVARKLGQLARAALPLILRVQDQTVDHGTFVRSQRSGDELRERDLSAQPADVLLPAHAQSGVDDEVVFVADPSMDIQEKFVEPMGQGIDRSRCRNPQTKRFAGQTGASRSSLDLEG